MGIIAILSSPSSFMENDEMDKIRAVIADGSAIFHYEVERHKHIAEALARFEHAKVDAIIILGDRALTSAIFEHIIEKDILKGVKIPLAILPAGDNYIVAESLGAIHAQPHMALKNILQIHKRGELLSRTYNYPLIKLEGVRGVGSLYGLFLCAGHITKKTKIFKDKISKKGILYRLRNWVNILLLIKNSYAAAMGKKNLEDAIRVNRNQRGAVVGHFFMLLITTLDKTFWGVSIGRDDQVNDEGNKEQQNPQHKPLDKAHFISVENTPQAVWETGKLLMRGNYGGINHAGNVIAEIQHARLVLNTPFVLDGSYYEADDTGELFISVTEHMPFIKLGQ